MLFGSFTGGIAHFDVPLRSKGCNVTNPAEVSSGGAPSVSIMCLLLKNCERNCEIASQAASLVL